MHAGHIFDEPCKLTAVRSTTMVNAATNDMPAPAKVASVRSLHTTEAKRDASGHTNERICSQLNANRHFMHMYGRVWIIMNTNCERFLSELEIPFC